MCTCISVHKILYKLGNVNTVGTKSSLFYMTTILLCIFCKFVESTVWVLFYGGQGCGADTPVTLRHHQLYLSALCFKRSFRALKSSEALSGLTSALVLEIQSTVGILFIFADQFNYSALSALWGGGIQGKKNASSKINGRTSCAA